MASISYPTHCPFCRSKKLIHKGTRKNQYRLAPRYLCKTCRRYFTFGGIPGAKYPPEVILKALSLYNLGYPQTAVAERLAARYRMNVSQRTISSWIKRYAPLCTFKNLRTNALEFYAPKQMIAAQRLDHRQVYIYRYHKAKLELLQSILPRPEDFRRLVDYLLSINDPQFPHRLFRQDVIAAESGKRPLRSSQVRLRFLHIANKRKENLANRLASQGLLLAQSNRERHKQIEDFMLINDSSTIATEVPVYLTSEHVRYFHEKRFYLPISETETPITGHIDMVQVRQRYIHILDYKPEASKVQPVSQLTIYALALASQTKLPLKLFKCAWFDEQDYFEFYPLRAVYVKREP